MKGISNRQKQIVQPRKSRDSFRLKATKAASNRPTRTPRGRGSTTTKK